MKPGAYLMDRSEIRQAAHMSDTARMDDRGADVIDQLAFDQLLAIPDGVEHLADRKRRDRVAPNHFECELIVGGRCILQPKESIWLEIAPQTCRFYRRHAVVTVVKQLDFRAVGCA